MKQLIKTNEQGVIIELKRVKDNYVLSDNETEYLEGFLDSSILGKVIIDGEITSPEVPEIPKIPLTNLAVTNATKVGAIYWAEENVSMTITANCALPDGSLIVMAEQVVDATSAVSDTRFKTDILNGVATIQARFAKSGNYMITADRVNRGLDRIGAGVHLSFDDIEFDIYVA